MAGKGERETERHGAGWEGGGGLLLPVGTAGMWLSLRLFWGCFS